MQHNQFSSSPSFPFCYPKQTLLRDMQCCFSFFPPKMFSGLGGLLAIMLPIMQR